MRTLSPIGTPRFTTNPAGAAIVSAVGPIRQLVDAQAGASRRWLVIAGASADGGTGPVEQVQR
jgi:hypothetical protein